MARACVNRGSCEGKQLLAARPCNLISESLRRTGPPPQKKQHLQEPEAGETRPACEPLSLFTGQHMWQSGCYKASLLQQLREYAQLNACQ